MSGPVRMDGGSNTDHLDPRSVPTSVPFHPHNTRRRSSVSAHSSSVGATRTHSGSPALRPHHTLINSPRGNGHLHQHKASSDLSDDDDPSSSQHAAVQAQELAIHLPPLFRLHGAMPIRRITHHLHTLVPALSMLPAGKQRRTVVRALESNPQLFKKIGWGTWTFAGSTETFSKNPNGTIAINKDGRDTEISAEQAAEVMMGIMSPETTAYISDEEVAVEEDIDIGETLLNFKQGRPEDGPSTDEEDWKSLGANSLRSRALSTLNHDPEPIGMARKESFGVSSLNTRLDSLKVGSNGLPSPVSSASPFGRTLSVFARRVQGESLEPPERDSGFGSYSQVKSDRTVEDEAVAALVQLSSSQPINSFRSDR